MEISLFLDAHNLYLKHQISISRNGAVESRISLFLSPSWENGRGNASKRANGILLYNHSLHRLHAWYAHVTCIDERKKQARSNKQQGKCMYMRTVEGYPQAGKPLLP